MSLGADMIPSPSDVTVALTDAFSDATNGSSFTFTAKAIGSSAGKLVVGVSGTGNTAAARSVSSIKVHIPDIATDPTGTSLTLGVAAPNATENHYVTEAWHGDVAAGPTADIVVVWNTTMSQCVGGVYRAANAASALAATATDLTGDPLTTTIDCPSGGAVVAFAAEDSSGGFTWTAGLTEDGSDNGVETCFQSKASAAFAVAQVGLTITADQATNSRPRMAVLSLAPG